MRPCLHVVGLLLGLVACGARTSLPDEAAGQPEPDAGGVASCRWTTVGQPTVVVDPTPDRAEIDHVLGSILTTDDGALVGYTDTPFSGLGPHGAYVKPLGWDGVPAGDAIQLAAYDAPVAEAPRKVSLASSNGRVAATIGEDHSGCAFVPLDATGTPAGPPVVSNGRCALLRPYGTGFVYLDRAVNEAFVVGLDTNGTTLFRRRLDWSAGAHPYLYGFDADPDGTFWLLWAETDGTYCVGLQRFAADGAALTPRIDVHCNCGQLCAPSMIETSAGRLLVWEDPVPARPTVAVLDPAGAFVSPPRVLDQPYQGGWMGFALAAAGDDVLAIWSYPEAPSPVLLAVLSPSGDLRETSQVILPDAAAGSIRYAQAVRTPLGALAVIEASGLEAFTASYGLTAVALRCEP